MILARVLLVVLFFGAAAANASSAHAVSGTVWGKLEFYNQQKNYCDTSVGMDCTAARFPASQSDSYQPVKEADLIVYDGQWNVIGSGSTNYNGDFAIYWERGSNPGTDYRIRWVLRNRDGHFKVTTSSSLTYYGDFTGLPALVTAQPVYTGTLQWGATGANNIFDGAARMWHEALSYSGLMVSSFNDVTIRYPITDSSGGVTGGASYRIDMGANSFKRNLAIAHEMGHMADYVAKPYQVSGAYNFPAACSSGNCPTSDNWQMETQEHYSTQFTEGFAEVLGVVSTYWSAADAPVTCATGTQPCIPGAGFTYTLEDNAGVSCGAAKRHPLSVTRFVWDVYDAHNDVGYSDNVSVAYWSVINALQGFLNSTGNLGNNEPWNSSLSAMDDEDGRSAGDYATLVSASAQYNANCQPGG